MTNVVVGTRHQVPAISPTTRLSHHHPRVLAFATPPKPAPLADLNCRCQVGPCVSAASATSGCPGYASPLAANGWCAAEPRSTGCCGRSGCTPPNHCAAQIGSPPTATHDSSVHCAAGCQHAAAAAPPAIDCSCWNHLATAGLRDADGPVRAGGLVSLETMQETKGRGPNLVFLRRSRRLHTKTP
eukprot:CAMPEP_0206598000 /NCGR_PEP_ID=MMETSP0325_2-20121206/44411_1 /ASSEMBLY_ACC=CAM_ASM_000347 /TAXON_ID=2866 /ORGANISM="Crypthecodinium cohnii, Strain Seligo" /LENGTH=184 /DNA_ID=CAMNT_0054108973 /DNA_START=248 /DNA_END=798 /DNA_ORIENTATION=-